MRADLSAFFYILEGRSKNAFAIALISLAVLCTCAAAQEKTAEDWLNRGQELYKNGSYQEALNAFDEGLGKDPQNASAWHYRGLSLAGMGHGAEANRSIQKAMLLLDQRLQKNPEDQEALWLRAEEMDLLGRSGDALEAYGRVAELNSTHALGAWIRESDILVALGRYNESFEAFSRAMALVPANRSQSQIGFQRLRENSTILFTKAWLINGQIHRVSIGLYNVSTKSFDEIEQINSEFVGALQLKDKAADPGRHGGSLMGSSLNCDVYSFNQPKAQPPAWPSLLTIAGVNLQGDEFIEVINGLKETVSFRNWSLEIQGSRISLPEHSLLPGKAVRIHLGSGQENETDLFLSSDVKLNDTAGNLSLRDGTGAKIVTLDYWTRLDGSIARSVIHFSATKSDLENGNMARETTAEYWIKEGHRLYENDSLEQAAQAYDKAIRIDPGNASAWLGKGEALVDLALAGNDGFDDAIAAFDNATRINPRYAEAWFKRGDTLLFMALSKHRPGIYNESLKSLEKALEIDPEYSEALVDKGNVLLALQKHEDAVKALDTATSIDSKNRGAWITKADALANLQKYNESIEAYDKAIENCRSNSTAELASIWFQKSSVILKAERIDEALNASEKVIELNSKFAPAWYIKGTALKALGRNSEADAAFAKAKELGYLG
jgi:tetratricopeptide (TPR) repeat protein